MNLLVIGTSHAGTIRQAELSSPLDISYAAIPHGTGPNFTLSDDLRLVPTGVSANRPVHLTPTNVLSRPINTFDAILISALECFSLTLRPTFRLSHPGAVYRFGARQGATLISEPLLRENVIQKFLAFEGVQLLRQIREKTSIPVLVQTAPLPSDAVLSHPEWALAQIYDRPVDALHYFVTLGRQTLQALCDETGAIFLDIPDPAWIAAGVTPAALMTPDMTHGNTVYGEIVLRQVGNELARNTFMKLPA